MIVTREREKLLAAIVFFCQKTKHCHTLKLFKLLNFLDFEHFRQTGRTVTGLDYSAFERGPVPPALWGEIKDPPADLSALVAVLPYKDDVTGEVKRRDLRPKAAFNSALFTKREVAIMERLAEFFSELKGENMTEFSHMKGLPWRKVWAGGKGKGHRIPPELALDSDPLDYSAPTIDAEELALRRDLRRGVA